MDKPVKPDPCQNQPGGGSGIAEKDIGAIVNEYTPLAYGMAKKYTNRGLSLEDLRQEALIGVMLAARHYDPGQGASFSSYAVYWIKKQLLQAIGQENLCSLQAGELSQDHPAEEAPEETPPAGGISRQLPDTMPALERRIILQSFEESLTLKEISRNLGISVERVKQLRGRALRRIKSNCMS
ncbi:MAG: sigma-70 family RNA polymerase sigma factor [Candidatus Syntrophosphaera sp.]